MLGSRLVPESIPALCEAWADRVPEVRVAAGKSLRRLLPNFAVQWQKPLDSTTIQALCCIAREAGETLALPALRVLEQSGNGEVFLTLIHVAEQGHTVRLRARAVEMLPRFRVLYRQAHDAQRLLRPAVSPENDALLVRPAALPETTEETERLLHPAAPPA